jgi:hypothetical protein
MPQPFCPKSVFWMLDTGYSALATEVTNGTHAETTRVLTYRVVDCGSHHSDDRGYRDPEFHARPHGG